MFVPKYMYDQNTHVLPLFFICVLFYEYESIENINILAINKLLLTKS